jgi:hypothetical protein
LTPSPPPPPPPSHPPVASAATRPSATAIGNIALSAMLHQGHSAAVVTSSGSTAWTQQLQVTTTDLLTKKQLLGVCV